MKAKEVRELSPREIREKIEGMSQEYFNLRFQAKMGQLSNPVRMRQVRRDIARAQTVLTEKQRAEQSQKKGA
mgnify:CR=1 FL=1